MHNHRNNLADHPEQIHQLRDPRDLYLILGSFVILTIALFLRLWQLDFIPYPTFDEVYFPKYAEEYLQGAPIWEGHPPLAKYMIMLGIILFGHNAIGYRIASAVFGALVPVLVIGVAYRLTFQRTFALLSGLFLLSDGLFLVESRLGLINVFLVATGLTSQIFLLAGLRQQGKLRTLLLGYAGVMLGASASVKWNGLGFSLLLFLLILFIWAIAKFSPKHLAKTGVFSEIIKLHWWEYLLCFVIAPIAFYLVQWIPLLMLNSGGIPQETGWGAIHWFWQSLIRVHQHILWWHSSTTVITTDSTHPAHPYCSSAISWSVSARPVSYYFQNLNDGYFLVIHAIGNPILWWLSTLSVVIITGASILTGFRKSTYLLTESSYLILGYFANYAPWLLVKRCLFIYHYLSAALFSFMALAWLVSQMLARQGIIRYLGYVIIAIIILSQIFFMPIWLGMPISPSQFYQRIWFMPDKVFGFNWI